MLPFCDTRGEFPYRAVKFQQKGALLAATSFRTRNASKSGVVRFRALHFARHTLQLRIAIQAVCVCGEMCVCVFAFFLILNFVDVCRGDKLPIRIR